MAKKLSVIHLEKKGEKKTIVRPQGNFRLERSY